MNNLTDFLVGLVLCHIFYFGLVYLKRHLNWKEIKSTIPTTFYFDKDSLEFISFQVSSRGKNEEYFCSIRNGSVEEYQQETDVKQYTYRKPEEYTPSQKHCTRLDLSLAEFQDKEILKCKIKNLQLKYVLAIINYGIEDHNNRNKRFIRN